MLPNLYGEEGGYVDGKGLLREETEEEFRRLEQVVLTGPTAPKTTH